MATFDRQLLTIPGIKKLIYKLIGLAAIQALMIILEADFLAQSLVNAWSLKKVTASLVSLLLFFITFGIRYLITRIENQITDHFANQASGQLKRQLIQKIFKLGPPRVTSIGTGKLITLALEGIPKIQNYFDLIILKTINLSIIPWMILIAISFVNFLSGLILLLVFPLIIYLMVILGLAAQNKANRQYNNFTKMSNNFMNTLRGLKTLKLFGLSRQYSQNIFKVSENYRKATMAVLKVALLSTFTLDFMTTISIAMVAVVLGVRLINGSVLLFPALFVLIACPDYFLPLRSYGNDYHATLDGKNAWQELNRILQIKTPKARLELPHFDKWNHNSELVVDHLSYQYPDSNRHGIQDLSFKVKGPQKIGIVGASGAGKSTLLNLLGGRLQPAHSKKPPFKINQTKVDSLAQNKWQNHLSYIPQFPHLFYGTIAQNIAFYRPQANQKDIQKAVHDAGLSHFIDQLEHGLQTIIGKGGRSISGGQAQRIALARVLLAQNHDIILLDEPTEHLDIETEYQLKQTMLPILANHLVFFVTHRLHWMNDMDYLLVLKNGQLVEQGAPHELMQRNGAFSYLVKEIKGDFKNV